VSGRADVLGAVPVEALASLRVGAGMLAVAAVAVLGWAAAATTRAVGTPHETVGVLVDGFAAGWIWPHAQATFAAVIAGFLLAVTAGIAVGVWLGRDPYWRAVLEPVVMAVYSVPKITLYPVFILFLGLSHESRVAMAFIHAVFPVLLGVMTGVLEIDPVLVKLRRSLRLSRLQALAKIYVPAVAPALVAGARMGFSLAIIGVVLAELVGSREGLGRLVMDAYGQFDVERMFAVIVFLFVVAMGTNVAFWLFERRLRAYARA
jgi:NitT/TauT family transport system permease protein